MQRAPYPVCFLGFYPLTLPTPVRTRGSSAAFGGKGLNKGEDKNAKGSSKMKKKSAAFRRPTLNKGVELVHWGSIGNHFG